MRGLPENLFLNPVWHALDGEHKHLAIAAGEARRYPADVSPFAALAGRATPAAYQDLRSLMVPESVSADAVWMADDGADPGSGLRIEVRLPCLQMALPDEVTPPEPSIDIVPLCADNAAEMVALTDVAFPGFFRTRTHLMGSYAGVRIGGELAAMGGERLRIASYPELSGICTHPKHRGKGLATAIIWHLVRSHRARELSSWLHVGAENKHAIELYRVLGFEPVRTLMLRRISRVD